MRAQLNAVIGAQLISLYLEKLQIYSLTIERFGLSLNHLQRFLSDRNYISSCQNYGYPSLAHQQRLHNVSCVPLHIN